MFLSCAPRFQLGVLLAALLLMAGPGLSSSSAFAAAASDDASPLHIDFPGGTVEEYVAHIREIVPEANIVLMPDASKARIPSVNIKAPDGSLLTVVKLLEHITAASAEPDVRVYWDGFNMLVRLVDPEPAPGPEPATPRLPVLSYSLANVIVKDHIGAEDILRNIETSLEMASGSEELPDLRFHESTNLLIARGTNSQHGTIRNLLESMQESASEIRAKQAAPLPLFAPPAQDDQRFTEVIGELQKKLAETTEQHRLIKHALKLAERDEMIQQLVDEVRELRERLTRLEGKQE